MAFLFEKNHENAAEMPIGLVWELADLHTHIEGRRMATMGKLLAQIASATMGSEESYKALQESIRQLSD